MGLTTFYLKEGQGLNFAVPVEWVQQLAAAPAAGRGERVEEKGPAVPPAGKKPPGGWFDRLEALVTARDWLGLLDHGRRWTRAEPDNAAAWFCLGVAYGRLGRFREAVEACREALRLKPDYAEAWYNLALAYAQLGNRAAALQALQELRHYDPQRADKVFDLIMGR